MKNENKNEEMISIMEVLYKHVPLLTVVDSVTDPETSETVVMKQQNIHYLLFGGNQLTAEGVRDVFITLPQMQMNAPYIS